MKSTIFDSDDRVLRESLERMAHAWNAGDATGWAAEFWPDGEQVNIVGGILSGADTIRDRHAEIFVGPFKGSRFEYDVRHVQFLAATVAIVDSDLRVTEFRGLPPGTVATAPGVLLTRMKQVYAWRDGIWRIAAAQNTAVLPAAAHRAVRV